MTISQIIHAWKTRIAKLDQRIETDAVRNQSSLSYTQVCIEVLCPGFCLSNHLIGYWSWYHFWGSKALSNLPKEEKWFWSTERWQCYSHLSFVRTISYSQQQHLKSSSLKKYALVFDGGMMKLMTKLQSLLKASFLSTSFIKLCGRLGYLHLLL